MKLQILVFASLLAMTVAEPPSGYQNFRNIDINTLLAAVKSRTQQKTYSAPARQNQAYAVPAPQAYSAPAQQSYSAPSQQSYSAPSQQSYSAPAQQQQQSYSAPAQPEYSAPAPAPQISSFEARPSYGAPQPAYGEPEQEVHKHVYVHVAPQETATQKPIKPYKPPQKPEKHYKILFIKAPTPGPYEAPDIPELKPEAEQKTLVYVLLKKAEPTPALVLPTHAPTKPSKPEVYFIRYKTPEGEKEGYGAPEASQPAGGY